MKKIFLLVALVVTQVPAFSQQAAELKCGQVLYIAPMPNGLDGYIQAALVKEHFPLALTTDKTKADLVMTGGSNQGESHWYNAGAANTFTGNVTIADNSGRIVWSGSAGDRNIWWGNLAKHGPEKAAERIVGKLKSIAPHACQ
jgi:hypothetical protein